MKTILLLLLLCSPLYADRARQMSLEMLFSDATATASDGTPDAKLIEAQMVAPTVANHIPDIGKKVEPTRLPGHLQQYREVRKSRLVKRPKYCRGRMCGFILVTEYFTALEKVPETTLSAVSNQTAADYATAPDTISRALEILKPKPNEVFLDIGSGDGRAVIAAARDYGCRAIGIEQDHERVALARQNAAMEGLHGRATFIEGDFTKIEWPRADVGYVYLFPEDLALIRNKLIRLNRFVSFAHQVPGINMTSHHDGELYSWKSQPAAASVPGVWWEGRFYTKPVCNRWNCSMCAAIRAALNEQR